METISIRGFLTAMQSTTGAVLLITSAHADNKADFAFAPIYEEPIQPEIGAPGGVQQADGAFQSLPRRPLSACDGGELGLSASLVPHARADWVYDLGRQEARALGPPLRENNYLGFRFITGGTVCDDSWKGSRSGVPLEVFVVAEATDEEPVWRRIPHGRKASSV